ncbi:MAG: hypothetical protein HWD82_09810 [Flavobacteriaceae bacterium]|nr:hypothetical protein [Flavobacteriaceae bacterium]
MQNVNNLDSSNYSNVHLKVIDALGEGDLTSFQILNKLDMSFILELYNVIEDLMHNGIQKSYIKDNMKYYSLT